MPLESSGVEPKFSCCTKCNSWDLRARPIWLDTVIACGGPINTNLQAPDHGGGLTVKVYHSEKVPNPDHEWEHRRIVLACDTLAPGYEAIVLDENQAGDLLMLGEFKGTLER